MRTQSHFAYLAVPFRTLALRGPRVLISQRDDLCTTCYCSPYEAPDERLHVLGVALRGAARAPREAVRHVLEAEVLALDAHAHHFARGVARLRLERLTNRLAVAEGKSVRRAGCAKTMRLSVSALPRLVCVSASE